MCVFTQWTPFWLKLQGIKGAASHFLLVCLSLFLGGGGEAGEGGRTEQLGLSGSTEE